MLGSLATCVFTTLEFNKLGYTDKQGAALLIVITVFTWPLTVPVYLFDKHCLHGDFRPSSSSSPPSLSSDSLRRENSI